MEKAKDLNQTRPGDATAEPGMMYPEADALLVTTRPPGAATFFENNQEAVTLVLLKSPALISFPILGIPYPVTYI